MAEPNVSQLLTGESPLIEYKESPKKQEELYRAICAFANDLANSGLAGHLIVGVDKHSRVVGLPWHTSAQRDEGLQSLAALLGNTKMAPTPSVDVRLEEVEGKVIAILRITPYTVPPAVKVDGVAWVRVGTTTRKATEADLQRINERRPELHQPFDRRRVPRASIDDLDLNELRERWRAAQSAEADIDTFPEFEPWLHQQDIVRRDEDGCVPTVMGLLLHGIDPQGYFPGATIEFAKYAGIGYDDPVTFKKSATGTLRRQLDVIWQTLESMNVSRPLPPEGIRQGFAESYPPEALKELARNMVQHRTYETTNAPSRISWFDDRVEFNNPGGPFGVANEGVFGEHSDYRNPTITQRLVQEGYVQRLGRGVRVVRAQLERWRHPDLVVETDGYTILTVRGRP